MEQIIVRVKDKEKARLLLILLTALDFVETVSTVSQEEPEIENGLSEPADFFQLAGLWEGRDIDLASLRQKAWPRQR